MLLTDKQSDKQTNATKNITFLVEVINKSKFPYKCTSVKRQEGIIHFQASAVLCKELQ